MGDTIWFAAPDLAAMTASGGAVMPGLLGIEFCDYGDDWLAARMPVGPDVHQPFGRLHGGASVVLGETVASVGAAWTLDPASHAAVGMEINANHVRPVKDGFVTCIARRETAGRTSQVWTWRVTDEEDRPVCIGRITIAVIDNARK
ncbi:hotdog fold thioesterase [Alteriqipengyuania flavescens]|uniref:hotdog fold thioesterase n=1 Tax=Alteriqipengyuania flavescens TaxID=3053610 RepID=UPI0025B57D21|nr:hotdog fold thioesterase [Alteriqipengyuania flavescens]WJY19293.1 hotdog fold thioesterase [Alteriqipengyuania flavescens]WJY25234.1 hotdog fold thioesterase [Alteriqipengyuania flavescens]